MDVRFEEVTPDNWRVRLKVKEEQKTFAAGSAVLLARAWAYRRHGSRAYVIYFGEAPVGMALYYEWAPLNAYVLSELFIDEGWQGRGIGARAAEMLLDLMRRDGRFPKVTLCYVEGNDAARRMYEKLRFLSTGDKDGDEIIMEKDL